MISMFRRTEYFLPDFALHALEKMLSVIQALARDSHPTASRTMSQTDSPLSAHDAT